MKPKCPECGAELIKDRETIADWWCPACENTFDADELDWSDTETLTGDESQERR
jgi:ribosomal protein L37AE/L43A